MSELTLVTGGNGFLALHIIQQLLANNHPVRATLRTLNKADAVRQTLAATGVSIKHLSFVQADLINDSDWPQAVQGVTLDYSPRYWGHEIASGRSESNVWIVANTD